MTEFGIDSEAGLDSNRKICQSIRSDRSEEPPRALAQTLMISSTYKSFRSTEFCSTQRRKIKVNIFLTNNHNRYNGKGLPRNN